MTFDVQKAPFPWYGGKSKAASAVWAALGKEGRRSRMTRECLPGRRACWRQRLVIHDVVAGPQTFFVCFGEHADGRLGEVFLTASKAGTFARGMIDALARSISLALQSGSPPREVASMLLGLDYPPSGRIDATGSTLDGKSCTSISDYLGQEIVACYCEQPAHPESDLSVTGQDDGAPEPPPESAPGPDPPRWQKTAEEWGETVFVFRVRRRNDGTIEQATEHCVLESQLENWQRQDAGLPSPKYLIARVHPEARFSPTPGERP